MDRFWLVVLLFGKVASTMGPMPDEGFCTGGMRDLSGRLDQRFEADAFVGAAPARQDGRVVGRNDISLECRPGLDPPPKEVEMR
jgi:hypothetical protein